MVQSGAKWRILAHKLPTTSATNVTNFIFMTIKPELKGYKDKDGRKALYIRISDHGKRNFRKTQIKLKPTEWDKSKVKTNHFNHKSLNEMIKQYIRDTEAELINPASKYPDKDFYQYCNECLNEWDKTKAFETYRQHVSEINKLKGFAPSIRLSTVTPEWLNRYKAYCFSLKNSVNTVHKNLKFVRLIIRKARKERLIEHNPFDIFEMPKYRDPEKKYLTREEVQAIEKITTDQDLPEEIRFVATWFCIGCACGFRFSDMAQFDKKRHIINNRIILYTMKTGTPVGMPVSSKLSDLFERVGYKGVKITNTHFNRILKAVGTLAGLDNLSAHVSRHSFAMACANAGISQEVTAKLLGHTSLKTTALYYKISSIRIDEELKKLI